MASVDGILTFTVSDDGLQADERGLMILPGQPPLTTERRTLWHCRAALIEVRFADGRPFHAFDPAAPHPAARHVCAADVYDVAYDFTRWPIWRSVWTVAGPGKDQVIATVHSRNAEALDAAAVPVQNP